MYTEDFEDPRRHPNASSKFQDERYWWKTDGKRKSSQLTISVVVSRSCPIHDLHQRHLEARRSPSVQCHLRGGRRDGSNSQIPQDRSRTCASTSDQNRDIFQHLVHQDQSEENDYIQSVSLGAATKDRIERQDRTSWKDL
ncbi:hypothetical protein Trydic_g19038 [Trypoxylus dichotomus]